MVRKAYPPEQIINKLREAEVLLSRGSNIGKASKKIGVDGRTCRRWRRVAGRPPEFPGSGPIFYGPNLDCLEFKSHQYLYFRAI